jgi:hypothetical protein
MTRSSFLRRFGSPPRPARRPAARKRPAGRPLLLEPLEDRVVPDASLAVADVLSYAELDPTAPGIIPNVCDQAFDSSGNRYVLAERADNPYAPYVPFLARFNPTGQLDTTFGTGGLVRFESHSRGQALDIDGSDNIYVALDRLTILKLNTSGATVQQYTETRPISGNGSSGVADLATDAAGFVYYTTPSFTVKLESPATGADLIKRAEYGRGGNALDVSLSGDQIYVTGSFGGTVDFDPTHSYADNRDILSIGTKRNPGQDVFILELNQSVGAISFAWVGHVGGSGSDHTLDIAFDSSGVYVIGDPEESVGSNDFDPGPAQYDFYDAGPGLGGQAFLLKLTNSTDPATRNKFEWVKGIMGGSSAYYARVALDAEGNVYASAVYGTDDLDIETSYAGGVDKPTNYDPNGGGSTFVAAYTSGGVLRWVATTSGGDPRGLTVTPTGVHLAGSTAASTVTFSPDGRTLPGDPDNGALVLASYTQTADSAVAYVRRVAQAEGNSGTTSFNFVIHLTRASAAPVTVTYSTENGTATAGSDYTAVPPTALTFGVGETSKTVTVSVKGDTTGEADETFYLNFTVSGADVVPGSAKALATIRNDDSGGGKKLTAASLGSSASAAPLTAEQAQPLLAEAVARWQAAGVDPSALSGVRVRVRDLGGPTLGLAAGHTIWLDDDAAGWGWFIDPTPADDSEFTTPGDQGEQNHMDLLTVLMHEMGHVLGYGHDAGGVMDESLAPGVRLSPTAESAAHPGAQPLDSLFALLADPSAQDVLLARKRARLFA